MYPNCIKEIIEVFKDLPGIGEKTALTLISQYKTIENLYNHIDELKKFGSVVVYEEEGVIYLNTKDYSLGDTIYIEYTCAGGAINQKIYYEFSDKIPTDPDYCPYRSWQIHPGRPDPGKDRRV